MDYTNQGKLGESFSKNIKRVKIMEVSIAEASSMFPGFRFSPTDKELIQFYLRKNIQGCDEGVEVIAEVDICRHEPWDLPDRSTQAIIPSDDEWFFFSPRGRKYTNGSQCKRATELGYWKATGKERIIKEGTNVIGKKRTLVFHTGRAPKGVRTEWIMYQYCSIEKSEDGMVVCRLKKNKDFHSKDNVRRESQDDDDERGDDPTALLSGGEHEHEQSGMLEGNNEVENCCSNTHSLEQPDDTGSDLSEQKMLGSEFSHHESSSFKKSYTEREEEDDCYADILKDDIIKLDDNDEDHRPVIKLRSKTKNTARPDNPAAMPFQGTTHRRIRLGGQKQLGSSRPDLSSHQQIGPFIAKLKYPSVCVLVFVLVIVLVKLTML